MIVPHDPQQPITSTMWTALRDRYPNADRLSVAFELALDLEACAELLAGRPIDPGRLDPNALAAASARRLVRLDLCRLDLLALAETRGGTSCR